MSYYYDNGYLYKQSALTDTNTPVFYDAFSDYYKTVWKGIKSVYKSEQEIRDLSYYRALMCFYNETDEDMTDRQILLYHYMKRGFRYKDENSLLNRYKEILPIQSDMKNVLNDICTAYDEAPKRTFSNNKSINNYFLQLYKDAGINNIFATIYEMAKLSGVVIAAPIFKEGKLKVIAFTPDQFRVEYNPANQWEIIKITYPDWNTNEYCYHEWTQDSYIIRDYRGEPLKEFITDYVNLGGENIYSRIPFVILKIGRGAGIFPGGKLDMVYNQLRINKSIFASEVIETLTGFPIPLGINLNTHIISPDHMLGAKSDLTYEDRDPSFEWISPNTEYITMLEYAQLLKDAEKERFGIPLGDLANTSGISRVLARQKLIEERYRDRQKLEQFERNFIEMVMHIGRVDGVIKEQYDLNFSIDYADERVYIEPDVERDQDWVKVEHGEWSVEDFYTKWGLFDEGITENQLVKMLEKRMTTLQRVKEVLKSNNYNETIEYNATEQVEENNTDNMTGVDIEQNINTEQNKIENLMQTNI